MLPDGPGEGPCYIWGVRQPFVSTQKCGFWVARNGGLCSINISENYMDVPASQLLWRRVYALAVSLSGRPFPVRIFCGRSAVGMQRPRADPIELPPQAPPLRVLSKRMEDLRFLDHDARSAS